MTLPLPYAGRWDVTRVILAEDDTPVVDLFKAAGFFGADVTYQSYVNANGTDPKGPVKSGTDVRALFFYTYCAPATASDATVTLQTKSKRTDPWTPINQMKVEPQVPSNNECYYPEEQDFFVFKPKVSTYWRITIAAPDAKTDASSTQYLSVTAPPKPVPPKPKPVPPKPSKVKATVVIKDLDAKRAIRVNVNPDLGKKSYKVVGQKKQGSKWKKSSSCGPKARRRSSPRRSPTAPGEWS